MEYVVFYSYDNQRGGWEQSYRTFYDLEEACKFMRSVTEMYRPEPRLYQRMQCE